MKFTKEKIINGKKVNVVIEPDYTTPLDKANFRNAIISESSTLPKELSNTMKKEYDGIPNPNDLKKQNVKYSIFANNLDSYAFKDPKTIQAAFEKNGVHTTGDLFKQFQADLFSQNPLKALMVIR
ncbi:hypothetical protein KVM81_07245 [Helicobacter pylori]|nr:hypothetical protein KVM81_07245 [Helicobacter pylori]